MNLRLTIKPEDVRDAMPPDRVLLDAAARGMVDCVRRHLREKNDRTPPKDGFPKSNYYAEAAGTTRASVEGNVITVAIGPDGEGTVGADGKRVPGSGIALHYYGGTVYPKKKALAIPVDPIVAGIWPSSAQGDLGFIPTKDPANVGFLTNPDTGAVLWLLVPKATIPADPDVLPTDDEILTAAENAVLPLLEAS